jgi:hypothetical protein
VHRALRLVEDVLRRAAQHDRARLAALDAGEADQPILADHHLVDQLARPELDELGVVERRHDLRGARRLGARARVVHGGRAGLQVSGL